MSWKVYVNKRKCDGCEALHNRWINHIDSYTGYTEGECVRVCPVDVFEMSSDKKAIPTGENWCIGCESCMDVCPTHAVEISYS